MTAPHAFTFTPRAADIPPDVSLRPILRSVAKDHVYLPPFAAKSKAALIKVVHEAHERGVELTVVVVPTNPGLQAELRDVANEVGKVEHGTVLVLGPNTAGTYSAGNAISRVRLEAGEDATKGIAPSQPATKAQVFVDTVTAQVTLDWTVVTGVLLTGVVAAVGLLYLVKVRRVKSQVEPVSVR